MAKIARDKLDALLADLPDDDGESPARIPLPSLTQAGYLGPNPDATRKTCGGCWKFVQSGACLEVAGEVYRGQVCGYHVFGKPQPQDFPGGPKPKMTAAEAGLIETPAGTGTSCDTCRFFEPDEPIEGREPGLGLCGRLSGGDGYPPASVESLGCCMAWERGPLAPEPGPPESQL